MNRFYELLKKLTLTGTQCVYCGRELPQGDCVCSACEKQVDALKNRDGFYDGGLLYAYRYDGVVRALIHQFKYNDMPRYSVFIAQQMAEFLEGYEIGADMLTFVPIHKKRFMQRGYDQAEMIATHLSVLLDIPCKSVLKRVRDTNPQFKLSARQRKENIRGAFVLKDGADVAGKNILLIDDIYTTGITASEAMRPLKEGGASVMMFAYSKEFGE